MLAGVDPTRYVTHVKRYVRLSNPLGTEVEIVNRLFDGPSARLEAYFVEKLDNIANSEKIQVHLET